MAFTFSNRGLYTFMSSAMSGSTDLRMAAFTGTVPSVGTIRDWDSLADVIADASSAEAVASGYSRADLAGVTLAEDDALDRVTLVATAPTWTNVATGETWTFAAVYVEGASDSARTLIGIDAPASSLPTNGGNITGPSISISLAAGVGS